MSVAVLLLAAGASTRMRGGDKLLELLGGEPLLRRSARTALASGAAETLVVFGANHPARRAVLSDLPIRAIYNKDWEKGMGASIAAGAAATPPETRAVIVMPADMPDLTPALLNHLIDALPSDGSGVILRPRTAQGKPGNPVLFGADYLPALAALDADRGARDIIDHHRAALTYLDLDTEAVLVDLDTPEAWASYRDGRRAGNNI